MQSANYNLQYALSIPELGPFAVALGVVANLTGALANGSSLAMDATRQLVFEEPYTFGSGAWFLVTQCSDAVREELRSDPDRGWKSYITDCVGSTVDDKRRAYWNRARQVLGIS